MYSVQTCCTGCMLMYRYVCMFVNMWMPEVDIGKLGRGGSLACWATCKSVASSRVPTRWVITSTRMGCCWYSCLSSCPCSKLSSPMLRYLGLETQNWFTKLDSYLGLPSEYSLFKISRAYSLLPKDSLTQHIQAVHGNCSLLLALQ